MSSEERVAELDLEFKRMIVNEISEINGFFYEL